MSVKRQASNNLNRDNWDKEEPAEEMGVFTSASQDIIQKRVIKTAKRRFTTGVEEPKKASAFSGFSGFNKTQPSSFDFLANLTNGEKTNGSPTGKTETMPTSSLFGSKVSPGPTGTMSNLFSVPTTSSSSNDKSKDNLSTTQSPSSIFGMPATNTTNVSSIFTSSKTNSTVGETSFKVPMTPTSSSIGYSLKSSSNSIVSTKSATSSVFGTSSMGTNKTTLSSSSPFKIPTISNTTSSSQNLFGSSSVPKPLNSENEKGTSKKEDNNDKKKLTYYAKLKDLNESVVAWIKKHVDESPLCILSPIFKDYEKYLKEMQDEYKGTDNKNNSNVKQTTITVSDSNTPKGNIASNSLTTSIPKTTGASLFTSTISPSTNTNSPFAAKTNTGLLGSGSPPNFSFGSKSTSSASSTLSASATSPTFSFGVNTSSPMNTATSTTFAFGNNTLQTSTASSTPFSFGTGKPFSFKSNIEKKPEAEKEQTEQEKDDEPPKVEYTPVVEENSVYDRKCKIFVKKDNNFADKGVGTLYIKKIEESGKHQLLVRANTNLGNVLVNLILAKAIPTQRMGKNNVMMVCIPTPDAKPPPTPILIRVKTSEEADELLETLNKYKV